MPSVQLMELVSRYTGRGCLGKEEPETIGGLDLLDLDARLFHIHRRRGSNYG